MIRPDVDSARGALEIVSNHWALRWSPPGRPGATVLVFGRALSAAAPPPGGAGWVTMSQVHGARVVEPGGPGPAGEADAAVTTDPGLVLSVRVADCTPVALVTPRGLALAHAGWRGTAAGIAPAALRVLLGRTGEPAADVMAWIGPAIGVCCYEVGEEVARAMPPGAVQQRGDRVHVDLAEASRLQLLDAGVPPARIGLSGWCTRCHQHLFHSHRGSGGRPGRVIVTLFRHAAGEPPLSVRS